MAQNEESNRIIHRDRDERAICWVALAAIQSEAGTVPEVDVLNSNSFGHLRLDLGASPAYVKCDPQRCLDCHMTSKKHISLYGDFTD